eukprot:6197121-Pleurochrysis_carterae.AAC.2
MLRRPSGGPESKHGLQGQKTQWEWAKCCGQAAYVGGSGHECARGISPLPAVKGLLRLDYLVVQRYIMNC